MATDYRARSFWLDDMPGDLVPRPALEAPAQVDAVIVGAGYTGLWTAYYLAKADPHLRVAVVEKEIAGFGASGRNGGWVSPFFATPLAKIEKSHGREAAIAMQRAMIATVDEVGCVAAEEDIDAHYHKGGCLWLATSAGQTPRIAAVLEEQRSYGFGEEDWTWLGRREALARLRVEGCHGGLFSPRYASVQPARLARGLAEAVERLGVHVYERTPALDVAKGVVTTPRGAIRADVVVLATEGYTVTLPGRKRDLIPIYSLMIATEPLPADFWDEVGWQGREVFTDGRHLLVYAMRTAGDRIAIGGTVAPYHYGSRIAERFERHEGTFSRLHEALRRLFPAVSDAAITHRWGGPLGATRDWHTTVAFDRPGGIAWARGYVGDGVATANLAGRTLTDLILCRDSDLVHLPWVHHRSRAWEPEPLRWLAAGALELVMDRADTVEFKSGRPARWMPLVEKIEEIAGG
jgi:glycine/D-amino acid oxidase-like deaminating enzyme